MKFSELFRIANSGKEEWFDAILTVDTQLFVDPFLMYARPGQGFQGAHEEVIQFFDTVFHLIAQTGGREQHPSWKRALSLLRFPEVSEFCLGYTSDDTSGSGAGGGHAAAIADGLWEAIQAGVTEIRHFEEVSLLRKGIGADRISDITGNILRRRFAEYTAAICVQHNVPLQEFRYAALSFDTQFARWLPGELPLPRNPYSGRAILLTPKRFLKDLPSISSEPFWGYCFDNHNDVLRAEFGADVTRNVNKEAIVSLARGHADLRREFMAHVENSPPPPYDLERDKKGRIVWYEATLNYCLAHPAILGFTTDDDFEEFVLQLVEVFRNYVENNGGWKLLWNDDGSHKSEEAAQNLFLGITKHYCAANNVELSKEANVGRGPVDFKMSQGHARRALIEVKMARNTKFWNGMEAQLPTYLEAEGIRTGVFLVIAQSEADLKKVENIDARVKSVAQKTGHSIAAVVVDATQEHPSASTLDANAVDRRATRPHARPQVRRMARR